jgi:hypothetical protein
MFDYVNVEIPCPKCAAPAKGFQSKDRHCHMETLEARDVNRFYTDCAKCGFWIEYAKPEVPYAPLKLKPSGVDEITALGFVLVTDPEAE